MRRTRSLIATVLIGVLCEGAVQARAQQSNDDQTIRVNVDLIQVDVQVKEKKTGQPVGALTKDDFDVYEDGVKQQIATISRDQLPLSVVLLFDLTFTVQPVLKPLASGALAALRHLKPEDEVAVMTYAAKTELLQDFTTDREKVVAAIQKASEMASGDEAYFNQAIYEASEQAAKAQNPHSRRVVIWLTDNVPNVPSSKQHSEDDAFRKVFETGTVISAIVERSAASDFFMATYTKNPVFAPLRMKNHPGDVNHYAQRTGGDVLKASKEDISTKLAELIDEIRTRYTIGYYPSVKKEKGTFCNIAVKVRPETVKRIGPVVVRTKKGYYR